ncbi:AAA family ATPase [Pseudomonas viridiflava]|uniref:AAA family ATPase n=1 Tax=Pseudomonas viridiflava TaxID=33069 RepID=UPI000F03737B|nr:ATP-binding protein [Pseudomonas viridiflava]
MSNKINLIKAPIQSTNKKALIQLNGKNLIITGANGCGKTQLIDSIYNFLQAKIVHRNHITPIEARNQLTNAELALSGTTNNSIAYHSILTAVSHWKKELYNAENPLATVENAEKFSIDYSNKKAILAKFEAFRQANIRPSGASRSKEALVAETVQHEDARILFEEYLVSQKTAQAYAESPAIGNDPETAYTISAWFTKLENDLQELFEDQNLKLLFQPNSQSFVIKQNNKRPYSFQQLSSGFSAVLAIYADLLMRIHLGSTHPDQVYGIAFIDEIDAHLHVSIQRKIFSFLSCAFPRIQFIVTTHSPFVVSSVSDAVIYDLSSLQQTDDLSMFSYESILAGLFDVLPISEILKNKILELSSLLQHPQPDIPKLYKLTLEISEHENHLDSESAFFLKKAKIIINKSDYKGV